MTWRECKLVPRQVDFKVPKVECTDGEEIPYTELVDVEKIQMTTSMTCEVSQSACSIFLQIQLILMYWARKLGAVQYAD